MPTIPTNKLEQTLRAQYLQWLAGLPRQQDIAGYLDVYEENSRATIERLGGRVAALGKWAEADFPVPKTLALSPRAGTIYSEMKQAAISASITAGLNARDAARQMLHAGLDKNYRKLERLARTETVSAYWKNAFDSTADLPDIVMVWGSETSKRTCEYCQARDGLVIEDGNIRDHPNGRCTPVPTLRSRVAYKGTLQPDGSITVDPNWGKPVAKKPVIPDNQPKLTRDGAIAQPNPVVTTEKPVTMAQAKRDYAAAEEKLKAHQRAGGTPGDGIYDDLYNERNRRASIITELDRIKTREAKARAAARKAAGPAVVKTPKAAPVRATRGGAQMADNGLPKLAEKPVNMKDAQLNGAVNPRGWPGGQDKFTGRFNEDYQINCTRVSYASEMRLRGYDVQAGPAPKGVGDKKNINIESNWVTKDGKHRSFTGVDTPEDLLAEMMKQPEGSRFLVAGPWKQGGAHIWNAEIVNGKVVFHEGQVAHSKKLMGSEELTKRYVDRLDFSRHKGNIAGQPRFLRVDDMEPTDVGLKNGWLVTGDKKARVTYKSR